MSHKNAPPETPSQIACREWWTRAQPHTRRAWGRDENGTFFAEESKLLHLFMVQACNSANSVDALMADNDRDSERSVHRMAMSRAAYTMRAVRIMVQEGDYDDALHAINDALGDPDDGLPADVHQTEATMPPAHPSALRAFRASLSGHALTVSEKSDVLLTLDACANEIARLRSAIRATLDENGHLADGEDCTLILLKRALADGGSARVRCPDTKVGDSDLVGCGSTHVSEAYEEGFHDCFDCGLFFKAP